MNRPAIRNMIKQALINQTDALERVECHRSHRVTMDQMPIILISTPKESANVIGITPRIYERSLKVVIEAATKGSSLQV